MRVRTTIANPLEALRKELQQLRPPVHTVEGCLERDIEELIREGELSRKDIIAARTNAATRRLGGSLQNILEDDSCSMGDVGGFVRGSVTEVSGAAAGGKTHVGVTATAVAAVRGLRVLWIDAGKCSFDALHLRNVIQRRVSAVSGVRTNEATAAAMRRVSWTFTENISATIAALEEVADLIIIDAPAAIIIPNIGGNRSVLGHADMVKLGNALTRRAKHGRSAVVVVNSLVKSNSIGIAALGSSWAYVPSRRITVRCAWDTSSDNTTHTAVLEKDPSLHVPASCPMMF